MRRTQSLLGLSIILPAVLAQFVPAPTDLTTLIGYADVPIRYKRVPAGVCEQDPDVRSYAGYADVGPDEHIFWWFFESRSSDPLTAPVTTFLNGGPGSSSMIGLFQELGPCGVDIDGNVYNNPYSWSHASNMLFIDQPTQVGFSYSIPVPGYVDTNSGAIVTLPDEECPDYAQAFGTCGTYSSPNLTLTANSTANAAPNMWKTVQGFMGAFPQYSRDGFNFATESYGGHYAPVFNEYFETQNALNIPGAHRINLNAVLVGNGWYDPLIQYQSYYNFTVYPGNTYDIDPLNDTVKAQWYNNLWGPGNCVDMTEACYASGIDEVCSAADNFCYQQSEYLYDIYLGRDEYDIRQLTPDPFPYDFYIDYLNTPSVQSAIGAYQNFSQSSRTVGTAFGSTGDDDREVMSIEDVRLLLSQNVTVMMYAGDADYICNWIGNEVVANEVGAAGFAAAGYADIQTSDCIVHGQVKQSGLFSFARIYEAGHEVPFYQPLVSLSIFERQINRLDIATGTQAVTSDYRTVGPAQSTYREGNSTVQFDVLPSDATYNTTLNAPNPPPRNSSGIASSTATTSSRAGRFRDTKPTRFSK